MLKKFFQSKLLANTFYLYLLTFSTQLLNLVTISYQTRVLGPNKYGVIGFSVSIMSYVQLALDFGFILSGTESVSNHENDTDYLSQLFSVITAYKCFGGGLLIGILYLLCNVVPSFKNESFVILMYAIAYFVNALLPDYIYRGLEKMKYITIRTVCVKTFFSLMIFCFVKKESDYILLPVLLLIGNAFAVLYAWYNIWKEFGIRFKRFSKSILWEEVKKSFPFFVSRIAATVYQATNTVVLGIKYSGQNVVGYYTSADKIVSVAKSVSSPIADSFYPYMLKNKNYRLVKRILIVYFAIAGFVAIPLFLFSDNLAIFLFGAEYGNVGKIIRCLLPTILVIFPTYLITFPVLNPMGLSKLANFSNVLGAILQMIFLVALGVSGLLNVYSICISSSISECVVFGFRCGVWYKYRSRCKQ